MYSVDLFVVISFSKVVVKLLDTLFLPVSDSEVSVEFRSPQIPVVVSSEYTKLVIIFLPADLYLMPPPPPPPHCCRCIHSTGRSPPCL